MQTPSHFTEVEVVNIIKHVKSDKYTHDSETLKVLHEMGINFFEYQLVRFVTNKRDERWVAMLKNEQRTDPTMLEQHKEKISDLEDEADEIWYEYNQLKYKYNMLNKQLEEFKANHNKIVGALMRMHYQDNKDEE
jgi:predicted RNase H-like nuclease (RuvC/YqgF family)